MEERDGDGFGDEDGRGRRQSVYVEVHEPGEDEVGATQ